jgi:hypothetical protein
MTPKVERYFRGLRHCLEDAAGKRDNQQHENDHDENPDDGH